VSGAGGGAPGRRLAALLALLSLLVGAWRYAAEWRAAGLPSRVGELQLEGLDGTVEVRFDDQGVPHVLATTELDLARALGFLHANDRLFQMELGRRAAAGRMAEWFGARALEFDLSMRTLDLIGTAERAVTSCDGRSRAWYEAYASGVNGWIDSNAHDLPPEFRLLGTRPEPWTPTHSAAFAGLMARDLAAPGAQEVTNAAWFVAVGAARLAELLEVEQVQVPEGFDAWLAESLPLPSPDGDEQPVRRGYSNNWAVGAARTADGGALLAGDPHLLLGLPSRFFVVRMEAPGFDAFGATLAGHPALVIGRSLGRAWALTNTGLDADDLTLERIDEQTGRYLRPDGWRALERRTERFEVRFGAAVERTIRATERGPLLEGQPDADDLRRFPRSLEWAGSIPGDGLGPFLALARDEPESSVLAAASGFSAPAQNLLVAESSGEVWFTVLGRAPQRRRGDGRLPALGWIGTSGWEGLRARSENPGRRVGPDGALWTANQDVRPPDYPHPFEGLWAPPERAARIGEALSIGSGWGVAEFAALQCDLRSNFALALVGALDRPDAGGDAELEALIERLRAWDGVVDGADGALFALFVRELCEQVFDEGDGHRRLSGPDARQKERALLGVLDGRLSGSWFDVVGTEPIEGRQEVVSRALRRALELGRRLFGTDRVDAWDLRRVQRLRLEHPLESLPWVGASFGRGPIGLPGHSSTVAAVWRDWNGAGWDVVGGASLRFVTSIVDPSGTLHVQPGGQSGHPFDRHYDDQLSAWTVGEAFRAPWTAPDAEPLLLRPSR
jgi:penicillin amidase